MNIQGTLAVRYLSGRKLRTFLTTLAVVFGVFVLFGMNIVLPSMLAALEANVMGTEGHVDLTMTHVSGEPFDAAVFERAKTLDGIRAASASLNRTINLPADFVDHNPARPDRITALTLTGVIPEDARTLRAYPILAGRYLEAGDTSVALISQTLADALGVKVGDTFPIPSANGVVRLTVAGLLPPLLGSGNEEVLVTLSEAQLIANQPGRINAMEFNLDSMEQARREAIVAGITAALGPDYQVGALLGGAEMYAALQVGQQMIDLFGMLALFMGAFIIFNTFRTIIVERRRDIGMLRAIGATRRTILGMILVEGLVQGSLGTAAGLALGYLVAAVGLKALGPIMSQYINLKIGSPVVSPVILVVSIALGLGVTVLAGLVPALSASRVTPLEALRPSLAQSEFRRQSGPGFVVGAVLLALSLLALLSGNTALLGVGGLFFLVGLVLAAPALIQPLATAFGWLMTALFRRSGIGPLAQGNLARQPARTAITASTSMLGLAVVVAAGGMVASLTLPLTDMIKMNLGSDYLFVPPSIGLWNSDLGAGPELTQRLHSVDGVGDISTLRYAGAAVNGQTVSVIGIDPVTFPKVAGLRFQQNAYWNEAGVYGALANERALIANAVFLLQTQAKVGDTVTLVTPRGPQAYRVVALGADLLNTKLATAFISQANELADFDKAEDVFVQLNLKPGADAAATDQAIRAVADDYPQFKVISGKAYSGLLLAEMNAGFAGMYLVLALLALPSLIAMLNTLAISVIERTREIGMLRAVGSTQPQVQWLVLAEALSLAAVGIFFGLLAGLYLGYVLVSALGTFFPMGYTFPLAGIVAAVVIGLLFGALAAIIPARQAARLEIVEALRSE
jgi:putative ABC transport system permease protein